MNDPTAPRRQYLGVFAHLDALERAVENAGQRGYTVIDIYSPVPLPSLAARLQPQPSPVRFATFTGGAAGMIGGLALAILTSLVWNLIVFGKPVTDVIPFLVIAFEGTILFGAVATLGGFLFFSRLPFVRFPTKAYRPAFSRDRFGLWVACADDKSETTKYALRTAGAVDVQVLETGDGSS